MRFAGRALRIFWTDLRADIIPPIEFIREALRADATVISPESPLAENSFRLRCLLPQVPHAARDDGGGMKVQRVNRSNVR